MKKYLINFLGGIKLDYIFLSVILCFAYLVRYAGVKIGLPYEYYCDETQIVHSIFRMLKTGDYNPHFFNYPSLVIYLQAIVCIFCFFYSINNGTINNLDDLTDNWSAGYMTANPPIFYIWERSFTVLLGVLTIALVYFICRKWYSRKAAVMASLFLSASVAHMHFSRFIVVDTPVAFFILSTVGISSLLLIKQSRALSIFAGVMAGLSIATKYNAWPVAVCPLLAYYFNRERKTIFDDRFLIIAFCVGIGFFIGCPFAFFDLSGFLNEAGFELRHYKTGHLFAEGDPGVSQFIWHLKAIFNFNGYTGVSRIAFYLSILGIFMGFFKNWRLNIVLLFFPLTYMWFMCSMKTHFVRNMVVIVCFFCLFAGIGIYCVTNLLDHILSKMRFKKLFICLCSALLCLIIIINPIIKAVDWALIEYRKKDSRVLAVKFLKKNVRDWERVAIINELSMYKPHLDDLRFRVDRASVFEKEPGWFWEEGVDFLVTSNSYGTFNPSDLKYYEELFARIKKSFGEFLPLVTFGISSIAIGFYYCDPVVNVLKIDARFCDPVFLNNKKKEWNIDLKLFKGAKYLYDNKLRQINIKTNTKFASPRIRLGKGEYVILINAKGSSCNNEYPEMKAEVLKWNGVKEMQIEELLENYVGKDWGQYKTKTFYCDKEQLYSFNIDYQNDYYNDDTGEDRNLYINRIVLKRLN